MSLLGCLFSAMRLVGDGGATTLRRRTPHPTHAAIVGPGHRLALGGQGCPAYRRITDEGTAWQPPGTRLPSAAQAER